MIDLLVVDDDAFVLKSFAFLFPAPEYRLRTAATGSEAVAAFDEAPPDVVVTDMRLPDLDGLELVRRLQKREKKVPIVLMTGFGTAEAAIEAMRLGAFEYVLKPFDPEGMVALVERAAVVSRHMRVPMVVPRDRDEPPSENTLIGNSPAMQEVFKAVGRIAALDLPVLIRGESGTGKEMVARAIYHYSARSGERFLPVNCAAIPENLLESELFGHERGAFTGADRRRPGKFEQCDRGTLFLDEIGDMSPVMQTKMLRVLQAQEFERVGGTETIRTDVRVVAATHRNLEDMIAKGTFRQDLYYRLDVCSIHLPPLRERPADVPLLVDFYLRRFRSEMKKDVTTVSDEAMSILQEYRWPGNVRELQSAVKQALVQTAGPILMPAALPASVRGETKGAAAHAASALTDVRRLIREQLATGGDNVYAQVIEVVERQLLADAMTHTAGNLSRAARVLGISRPTLRAKLGAYSISGPPPRETASPTESPSAAGNPSG